MIVGATVTHIFYVRDSSGNPVTSVSPPSGTVLHNGLPDTVAVGVAQLADLSYRAQFIIPAGYAPGDSLGLALRAEHPATSVLEAVENLGAVRRPEATMFPNVARHVEVRVGGAVVNPPVNAFTVTPIIDGVDFNSIPVLLSTSGSGYYVSFPVPNTSAAASVHLRVRVTIAGETITETFRMEHGVSELDTQTLVVAKQRIRAGRRNRIRIASG